jgi:UDP-2,3-diacylglucosamine pyrophosphatase LpxH
MSSFRVAFFALVFSSFAASSLAQAPPKAPSSEPARGVIAVISDLHLGRGEETIGHYYKQEDFQWGEDFVTFLDALHRAGGGKVTLVIAGDMLELWESTDKDCTMEAPKYGCSEDEAIKRTIQIVSAHRLELRALGTFASRGSNKVVIIPGNHDGALVFPGVWNIVKAAAHPTRESTFEIALDGRWISPSGNVVVEHGHQFDDANSYPNWPKPAVKAPSGTLRLPSPFGERLVREFFDPLELKYPVVDNITGSAGLLYGVKREGLAGTADVFTDFLKLLLIDSSWRQFTAFLSGEDAQRPIWDLAAIRSSPGDFIAKSFPSDDTTSALAAEVLSSGDPAVVAAANQTLANMSDDEINTICESRFVLYLRAEKEGTPKDQRPPLCPQAGGNLGYLSQKTVQRVRGSRYYVLRHIDQDLAPLDLNSDAVTFVYGHTHAATRAEKLTPRFTVINTGAWQRLISADTVAAMAQAKGWKSNQVLDNLKLSDLPACYSFAWIPWEYGKPVAAKLRYWAAEGDLWKFTTSCSAREILPAE